jgi:Asp-tRNA(Asn)/Glu-tRNA(Gln) amidotransferase A subunit family amidase
MTMGPSPPAKSLFYLANALRLGEVPLLDYLAGLEDYFNEREPAVRAFLPEANRFDRLRREAEELLARYPEPEARRPPLFGIPIGVKDIFHVDGLPTRAGSQLPPERLQGPQADSVRRLKQAGALVLGKTVTTEFAYFAAGATHNPHLPEHTPGGSSSGSAAAVGAGICSLALGTQTIGSITRPASYCGIVGYKPTYERISRFGVIPLAPSLDHVGVFSPEVPGVELAASLLCRDWQLVITHKKPVLGVITGPYLERVAPEGRDHFRAVCRRLRGAGYELKKVAAMPDFEDVVARHNLIVAAEAAQVHSQWFAQFGGLYHPKTAELIDRGQSVSARQLSRALAGRQQLRAELTALMDEHQLDLWLSPATVGPAPKGLESTGDPVMNLPWTHSGLPTLNLPAGFNSEGLPMGAQLAGRWYADETLMDWAADMEPVVLGRIK